MNPTRNTIVGLLGILTLISVAVFSMSSGAFSIPVNWIPSLLLGDVSEEQQMAHQVLWAIRLPRILFGVFLGGALAFSGALMQGLFRNPIVDPGLIGISSGAALMAAISIVLGHMIPLLQGNAALSISAFIGGVGTCLLVYVISTRSGRTNIVTLLLSGVAIMALAEAIIGFMIFLADDDQLRDLTFWRMGSLSGATWEKLPYVLPVLALPLLSFPFLGKGLNALSLGEREAGHLGLSVERFKRLLVVLAGLCVGAGVAVAGIVVFVGLVVPHLVRLLSGPDHRTLLPFSFLLGAIVLSVADLLARTVVAPAELPIGIITAFLGAPFFLYLIQRKKGELSWA
ncbi:MAG: iron ABC transporter permease [Leptospiraceae bacterium]|nr:iron ABC transporter permease [Leptospiraceae bacterium]